MKEAATNTPQKLWRTEKSNHPIGGTIGHASDEGPSLAWRAAFKAQLTPDMMDDVTAYAARRASWIENQTGIRDPLKVGELVQDALGDTFAQVVAWDPDRCPLALHLKSVIRSRISNELERAEERHRVDIDDAPEDEVSDAMAATATPSSSSDVDTLADDFASQLRALAHCDEAVLRLIELYVEGITERHLVCRLGKMSKSTYHNAHRRLKRYAQSLPHHLVTAAVEAMA